MKGIKEEISKKNRDSMVDLVFGLMFDILWLSPYDHRRQAPAFVRFEQCARRMVMGLRSGNLAEMTVKEYEDISRAATELADSVKQLRSEGVVAPEIGRQASEQVQKLLSGLGV